MTNTKIPSVSFPFERAIGITKLKRKFTQRHWRTYDKGWYRT